METKLYYALKNGQLTYVEEVEKGLACGCICPYCQERLVAKKGEKRQHHFAHYSGKSCEYGYQTSLHLMAKEIIAEAKSFSIPGVHLTFLQGRDELLSSSKNIPIAKVYLEHRINDIIPDIVLEFSQGKKLLVEIYVTHAIDEVKLNKIKELDISTIEINLSKLNRVINKEDLTEILVHNNEYKKWIYNSQVESYRKLYFKISRKYPVVMHGLASHILKCPLHRRVWRGKYYANLIDDCSSCEYLLEYVVDDDYGEIKDEYILCFGHTGISDIPNHLRKLKAKMTNKEK